jgi:stearoyl-CoA desaturase (Delta-9 desaturase)
MNQPTSRKGRASLRFRLLKRLSTIVPWVVTVVPACSLVLAGYQLSTDRVGLFEIMALVVMYSVAFIGVSVGFHRLFAHRSFTVPPSVRRLFAICGSMALHGPAIWWAAVHRQHHRYTDQPEDPHTPYLDGSTSLKGLWHAHMGWLFTDYVTKSDGLLRTFQTWTPDLIKDDAVLSVHMRYWECVAMGVALPAMVGGVWYGSLVGVFQGMLWGGFVRIFLMSQSFWVINSLGHTWGRRPFKIRGHATNIAMLSLLTFGESWHHNHHAFPTSARMGLRWWQLDPGYWFIRGLGAIGVATDIRIPSSATIRPRDRSHDEAKDPQ